MKYGEYVTEQMKNKLQEDGKVATGELINSLEPYVEEEDDKVFLYVDVKPYGRYVDEGRKPGKWPPRKAIREWIKQKGIRPRNKQTEEQTTFLIQRSIGIRGIKASPFLDIWDMYVNELEEIIAEAAAEDVVEVLDEFIKDFNKNNSIEL